MPKSMRKFVTFQAVPKIEQIRPMCDLEPIRDQRVELEWQTFGGRGPQGAALVRQKKEGKRQKERRTKKERVRKVEKGTRGI